MEAFVALLKTLVELLKDPMMRRLLAVAVATWLLSMIVTNAVTSMRRPDEKSSETYRYWFTFLNGIVGSWKRVEKKLHVPGADDDTDGAK